MIDTGFTRIKDGNWIEVPEIEKIAKQLVERYKYQSEQYNILKQENDKLKNGVWEKQEVDRLKCELDTLRKSMAFSFMISEEENDKIKQWMSKRENKNTGAIGGRYEYKFFPTSIGIIGKVVDTINNESFTFRDIT